MNAPSEKPVPRGALNVLDSVESFCASLLALALPWEVYQRVPFTGTTVVKLAGFGLIVAVLIRCAVERRGPVPRTGLNGPFLLLVLAAIVSTMVSNDRTATIAFLGVAAMHWALFFAVALSVRDHARAERLVVLYLVSCGIVGVLSLACKAGFLLPTYWRPSVYPWSQRLVVEATNGTPMRLAAASTDLNQGALLLLIGFAASLHVFDMRTWGIVRRSALLAAQIAMLGGCVVAQSRSALMAAAAITVLSVAARAHSTLRWRARVITAVCAAIALALVVWIGLTHFTVRDEDSVSSRLVAYRAAVDLLPRYLWLGTGLNASDQVIAITNWGSRVDGATVHSVPLKVLLESGILGLLGYVALWVMFGATCVRAFRSSPDSDHGRLAAAGLAVGAGILAMSFVQPFMTLPVFPVFFGIVLGPLAAERSLAAPAYPRALKPMSLALPSILVGALVTANIALYQAGAARVDRLARHIEAGATLEREGRYDAALAEYEGAIDIAAPALDAKSPLETIAITRLPGFDALSQVIDLPRAYFDLNVFRKWPDPRAVALYAQGRCYRALGSDTEAVDAIRAALEREPDMAEARFALARVYWEQGNFVDAVASYERAAIDEMRWPNRRYRESTKRLERRLSELSDNASLDAALERARILRLRGRWPEAADVYATVADAQPNSAEALSNLGVDAEVRHDARAALEYYRRATEACSNHLESRRRLDALTKTQGAP